MYVMEQSKSVLLVTGRAINEVLSFIVFSILDVLDIILCYVYRVADFFIEGEWKPCYCSPAKEAVTSNGFWCPNKGSLIRSCVGSVPADCSSRTSPTPSSLVPSLISEVSTYTVNELKRLKLQEGNVAQSEKVKRSSGKVRPTFAVKSTYGEMLHGKIRGQQSHPIPRWSDCDCKTCTANLLKFCLFWKDQDGLCVWERE